MNVRSSISADLGRLALGILICLSTACGQREDSGTGAPSTAATPTTGSRSSSEGGVVWFEDVAASRGIDFVLRTDLEEGPMLPEIVAGGGAAADFDDDGDLDLYLVQATGEGGNRLYRNLGDGRFEDASAGSGASDADRFGMGAATGDFDGDGDVDIYVSNLGRDTLLRNEGELRFTDVTEDVGLGDPGFSASAAFFDGDGDGDLELFVTRYVDWSPSVEMECRHSSGRLDYCPPAEYDRPTRDLLYRNDGARFVDVSNDSGIASASGTGLGVAAVDADGDGRLDVFVANDGMPDHLWMNRGDLLFEEQAVRAGCDRDLSGIAKAGMGVVVEDVDDDGDQDILVCNLGGETDSLHINEGGRFVDGTNRSGLGAATRRFTRFGLGLFDFDRDGWLDLYAANGRVGMGPRSDERSDPYAESDLLLSGSPSGRFRVVKPTGGALVSPRTSRGAIFGDFDDDGGVDVVVVDLDTSARLMRNVTPDAGNWILLDIRDDAGAPAIGAVASVDLPARNGSEPRRVTRTVRTDGSYLSARDPRVHVGLGGIEVLPSVRIRWPDGRSTVLEAVEANQVVQVAPPATEDAG